MVIEIFLDVGYIISQLNYIIVSPSSQIWVWLEMGHTHILQLQLENPLVTTFRNHPWLQPLKTYKEMHANWGVCGHAPRKIFEVIL